MTIESSTSVSAIETHISEVFLGSDRVYKRLKAVSLPFVDLTTPALRCEAAAEEFAQNQAISPNVYLALADVVENGEVTERLIVMRRLPAEAELSQVLARPGGETNLRAVARRIARLHMDAPAQHAEAASAASAEAISRNWENNFDALEPSVGSLIDPATHNRIKTLARRWIEGRSQLFDDRIAAGWVRLGHGDLRAEHIYATSDGVELIDCVAFDEQLRIADVLCDVAFLAMDLERLVGPHASQLLVQTWAEFTGESHPSSLAHFYVAYRAHVRAKIAAMRARQGDSLAGGEAGRYLALCLRHLELASIRVVMVGGGPGTGKSTVAEHVARSLGASWVRADEVRKDLAGIGHGEHAFAEPGEGIYTAAMTSKTQQQMRREAEELIKRGVSVVLDSTWSSEEHRTAIRDLVNTAQVELTELLCELDPATARERIARRLSSFHEPSDATPDLVDYVAQRFDPWPEAITIDTANSVASSTQAALNAVLCIRPPLVETHVRVHETLEMPSLREFLLVVGSFGDDDPSSAFDVFSRHS